MWTKESNVVSEKRKWVVNESNGTEIVNSVCVCEEESEIILFRNLEM